MKTFSQFSEDSGEALARRLASLERLEQRRELAKQKSKEIPDKFKQRSFRRLKKIRKQEQQTTQDSSKRRNDSSGLSNEISSAAAQVVKGTVKSAAKGVKNIIQKIADKKKST
jgi:F0F1-type ATP synthase membrane subunit b/b'